MNEPLVSVIVPTLNAASTVREGIESIKQQTYGNIEIIVVDKGSKDDTASIARAAGATVYVIEATERSQQKNHGARVAQGKYIYFVDSDFKVDREVVMQAVARCEEEGFDSISVHNSSDPSVSFWAEVRMLERDCYKDDDVNVSARFVKRARFLEIGGFHEHMVACEDYDIQNRMVKAGFKIGTIAAGEVHLGEPRTLGEIARKHYYYGMTLPAYIDGNRDMAGKQLTPFRRSYLNNWRAFLQDPVVTGGFFVYQFVRYGTAMMGYVSGRLFGSPIKP